MSTHLWSIAATAALLFLPAPIRGWWLYAWPRGGCAQFDTCQTCVTEYSYDETVDIRRPCTYCPATGTCEMMNQWTGQCDSGSTVRDTCPISTEDLPECVYLKYSFWFTDSDNPDRIEDCNLNWAMDFASKWTDGKVMKICNGQTKWTEQACSGWVGDCSNLLSFRKDPYGLEITLDYAGSNAGYGEDRRIIEIGPTDTPKWICNAVHQGSQKNAMLMEYEVLLDGGGGDPGEKVTSGSGASGPGHVVATMFLLVASLMFWLQ